MLESPADEVPEPQEAEQDRARIDQIDASQDIGHNRVTVQASSVLNSTCIAGLFVQECCSTRIRVRVTALLVSLECMQKACCHMKTRRPASTLTCVMEQPSNF